MLDNVKCMHILRHFTSGFVSSHELEFVQAAQEMWQKVQVRHETAAIVARTEEEVSCGKMDLPASR